LKVEKDNIKELDVRSVDATGVSGTRFLTEEERKKYLRLWKIMYIVIPLLYFFLTLVFR